MLHYLSTNIDTSIRVCFYSKGIWVQGFFPLIKIAVLSSMCSIFLGFSWTFSWRLARNVTYSKRTCRLWIVWRVSTITEIKGDARDRTDSFFFFTFGNTNYIVFSRGAYVKEVIITGSMARRAIVFSIDNICWPDHIFKWITASLSANDQSIKAIYYLWRCTSDIKAFFTCLCVAAWCYCYLLKASPSWLKRMISIIFSCTELIEEVISITWAF